jgi:hypothetical protein
MIEHEHFSGVTSCAVESLFDVIRLEFRRMESLCILISYYLGSSISSTFIDCLPYIVLRVGNISYSVLGISSVTKGAIGFYYSSILLLVRVTGIRTARS